MSGAGFSFDRVLNTFAAWALALLWVLPLAYAIWTAFHSTAYEARFELLAPLTLDNFAKAWDAAPFARYFLNTFLLVSMILAGQFFLGTLAAFAFARRSASRFFFSALTAVAGSFEERPAAGKPSGTSAPEKSLKLKIKAAIAWNTDARRSEEKWT